MPSSTPLRSSVNRITCCRLFHSRPHIFKPNKSLRPHPKSTPYPTPICKRYDYYLPNTLYCESIYFSSIVLYFCLFDIFFFKCYDIIVILQRNKEILVYARTSFLDCDYFFTCLVFILVFNDPIYPAPL